MTTTTQPPATQPQVTEPQATEPINPHHASTSRLPLFFQQRFWPMWVALSLGTFADNTLRQALLVGIPYGAIDVTWIENRDDAVPLIGSLIPVAMMLFSTVSGQLADKFETSMMFRRTKAVEILLMSVAAIAFMTHNSALAIFILFAMGAQSAFFSPVRIGAMPKYLAPQELVRGNGLCNAGLFTCILLGYAVGGYLIVQDHGSYSVGIVLIVAAVFGWLAILKAPPAAATSPDLKLDANMPRQAYKIFQFVFRSRGVAPPLFGYGAFYALSTAVTVATPLFARDTLNADSNVAVALNGLFAVGALIGALGAASLARGRSGLGYSTGGIIAGGVLTLGIYLFTPRLADGDSMNIAQLFTTPAGLSITLAMVAAAALMGLYIAPLQAAIQRRAPAAERARILSASNVVNAAFAFPGSLSILAITRTGADPSLAFAGVGIVMLAIGAFMYWRRATLADGLYDEMLTAADSAVRVDDPASQAPPPLPEVPLLKEE